MSLYGIPFQEKDIKRVTLWYSIPRKGHKTCPFFGYLLRYTIMGHKTCHFLGMDMWIKLNEYKCLHSNQFSHFSELCIL